jgi:hypothetical protein
LKAVEEWTLQDRRCDRSSGVSIDKYYQLRVTLTSNSVRATLENLNAPRGAMKIHG